MASPASQSYTPGVCNIGPAERRMRRLSGVAGAVVTVAVFAALIATGADWAWRLVLVIPATFAAMGILQDRLHFCAAFGLKGVFNVINSAGVTDNVDLESFRQQDRQKAIRIVLWSIAIGLIVTAVSLLF